MEIYSKNQKQFDKASRSNRLQKRERERLAEFLLHMEYSSNFFDMVYKDAGKIFNGERLKHNLNYIFSFMINNKTVRLIFKPVNLGVDDYDKLLKSHTKVEIIEIDFEHYT